MIRPIRNDISAFRGGIPFLMPCPITQIRKPSRSVWWSKKRKLLATPLGRVPLSIFSMWLMSLYIGSVSVPLADQDYHSSVGCYVHLILGHMWPTSGIPGSNTAYFTQPNKTVLDQIFDGSVRNSWLITAVLSQNAFTSWTSKVPFLRKIPLEFLVEDRLWVCLRSLVSAETKVGKPIENYSLKSSCIHFSFASTGKMLSGKLIFSFKNGLNLSLDQGRLADGSIMKFGLGFEHLDMTSDGLTLTTVDNRALADKKPVLEFNVSYPQNTSSPL